MLHEVEIGPMRLSCLLLLALVACSQPVVTPTTYTYDDGKGTSVQLDQAKVKVTSTHFEALDYQLSSDNMALELAKSNQKLAGGTTQVEPPRVGNGKVWLRAGEVPEAQATLERLVPRPDTVGPDSVWVGGQLEHQDLEGGFWAVTSQGNRFVLSANPPEGFKAGDTVIVTGSVNSDEMSAANAGPLYRTTDWRHYR